MKKDSLKFTILIVSIIVLAVSFLYFYQGLKRDLDSIIADKSLNTSTDSGYSSIHTTTPVAFNNIAESSAQNTYTPAIVSAYYFQVTPDPQTNSANQATPGLQTTALRQADTETQTTQSSANTKRIIIYNTHSFEKLDSGWEITDFSKTLADKLNDLGVLSIFLNNSHKEITDSYLKSRNLIMENIVDYRGNIILDIHAKEDFHIPNKEISIWIGKGNENFEKNKEFAGRLINEINNIESGISCELIVQDKYIWNQDLSDKAIMLIIGDENASEERANQIIDVLAVALENLNAS